MTRANVVCAICTLSLAVTILPASAADVVRVSVDPSAPKLEQMAAEELRAQFRQLVAEGQEAKAASIPTILVGSPTTSPAIKSALGDKWPKVSEQGIVLKSVDAGGRRVLVVGGG